MSTGDKHKDRYSGEDMYAFRQVKKRNKDKFSGGLDVVDRQKFGTREVQVKRRAGESVADALAGMINDSLNPDLAPGAARVEKESKLTGKVCSTKDFVTLKYRAVIKKTDKAALIAISGRRHWFPLSQITFRPGCFIDVLHSSIALRNFYFATKRDENKASKGGL